MTDDEALAQIAARENGIPDRILADDAHARVWREHAAKVSGVSAARGAIVSGPEDFKTARAYLMGLLSPARGQQDSARRFTRDEVLTVLKAHITTLDPKNGGPAAVRDLMHIFERME